MGNNPSDARAPESETVFDDVDNTLARPRAGADVQTVYREARDRGAEVHVPRSGPVYGGSADPPDAYAKQEAAKANAAGVDFLKSCQHDEAVKQFKIALSFEPGSVQILNNIGLAHAKMQDFAGAYDWYEKAYKQDTGDVETLFSLAWVERKRQRYLHARELFQKVLDMQPDHVKALYLLGDILRTAHDYDGAVRYFERLVRLDANSVDGHVSLAQCYEHAKQYQRAIQMYNHASQLAPNRMDVSFFLGRVYYFAKQYKQCVLHLERIPDADTRAFEARTYSAKACRELEDHDRAIVYAERAAHIRQHPDVMYFLGDEFLRKEDQLKAVHWFNRAIDVDPNHAASLLELGQLMYKQSRWQEAETHFNRLVELDRSNVSAFRHLALTKYKQGKFESSRQCCESVLRLEPLNPDALWILAELHRNDAPEERWFLSLRYPSEVSVADVCQTIAKTYFLRKQSREGVHWLQKVQHYLPSDARVREALQLAARQGIAVNVQEVIDILEKRNTPGSASLVAPLGSNSADAAARKRRTGDPSTGFGISASGGTGGDSYSSTSPIPDASASRQVKGENREDLEKLFRRAERAGVGPASEHQWKEVLQGAKAALQRRPADAFALKCAARALLSTGGDVSEIREYARRASASGSEAPGFTLGYELHAYLGGIHERERDTTNAEKHYTAALSSKPGDESAMLGLIRVLIKMRETSKARTLCEQVSASNPSCAESNLRLAEILLEAGENNEAYLCALKASKLNPADSNGFVCLGQACDKTGRNEEAVRAFEKALSLKPTETTAMLSLGMLLRKLGRDQDAIAWFKRLLDIRPGDYECSLNLAELHALKGAAGASQSVHYFRSALQCRPSSREAKDIYLQMSTVQGSISAWKDALQTLEGAKRELPDDAEILQKLATVYENVQDKSGQMQCFRKLVQLGAMTPARRASYGEALLADGQMQEARDQLQEALKVDPKNATALLKLATCWRQDPSKAGYLEEAKKNYEQVIKVDPQSSEALEGAAYCYRKMNNQDTAIQLYQQCLKVRPSAEGPLYYLGDILYRQHRHAECQHYLVRLVETNCAVDYKTGALYLLAKSHVSLDEYEEAEKYSKRGLDIKPKHPHFLFILALVKNRMARYDSSITTLNQALDNCEQSESEQLRVEIHDWLAQAYERKREYATAMKTINAALQKDASHVSSLITKGLVHIHMNQLDQAESSFRKALSIEKNHALALVRLGYCKLLGGDHHEAIQLFQRALQQRCGTVALPRSVKGCARIYMALAFLGQQDVDQALAQLQEARKTHKNFNEVCTNGKSLIAKSDCDTLATKLRCISDLDVNSGQAWQLIHLLAKELEQELGSSPAGAGRVGDAKSNSPGYLPDAGVKPVSSYSPPKPETKSAGMGPSIPPPAASGPTKTFTPPARGAAASSALPPPVQPPQTRTVAEPAPADPPATRQWVAPESAAPPATRQWLAPEPAQERRGSGVPTPAPVPPQPKQNVAEGQKNLRLEKHEQIEFSQLKQNECLGTGGFGAVYRGYFGGKEVAIKRLFCEDGGQVSPMQLDELEKEVAALRGLNHPRLVAFIGACLQPPNLCIVTEFMPGGSLHHLLHKAKTPLVLSQQAKIALQVCEGTSFLHSCTPPVVHRDLKSLNIVLDREYNAKICDFGLTQSMEKTHISLKDGNNGGSPRYMAPEFFMTDSKITEKVDVWAMACILIEVFGGPQPYDDCINISQIVTKMLIDNQQPYIPHHLPRGVRPIVEDCFHFDVKKRTTAQDVFQRLRQLRLAPLGD